MTVRKHFFENYRADMTVRKHFFENYRGGHDLWADMTSENTVYALWCSSLTNINLSNFNTNNVTYMSDMFYGCSSLTKNNVIVSDKKILKEINN